MVRELGETDRLLILKKPFDNIEVRQLAASLQRKWELARQAEAKLESLERMVAEQTRGIREAHEETILRLGGASGQAP